MKFEVIKPRNHGQDKLDMRVVKGQIRKKKFPTGFLYPFETSIFIVYHIYQPLRLGRIWHKGNF